MIMTLLNASFEQLKYYIYGLSTLLLIGLLFFVFHKPFRAAVLAYVKNNVFFLTVFGLYVFTWLFTRLFFFEEVFVYLYDEDGPFEYLTTIFFLIASVFFVLMFFNSKKELNGYMKFVILALAILCFFVGMEEISWGQRILGIETPEEIKAINYQGETTLHNLIDGRILNFMYLPISICLLLFFAFKNTKYDYFFGVPRKYMPSKKFTGIALLLPLLGFHEPEHLENVISFVFCVYAFQLYKISAKKDSV